MCELRGILIIPQKAGNGCSEVKFLVRSPLPKGRCVSLWLLLGAGTALPGLQLWSSTAQIPLCLVRRQILPSTKPCCPELAHSQGNSKPLSTALSFMGRSCRTGEAASWVVLTFRNWVGSGEPFSLGQASRPRSLPGNSI